MAIKVSRYGEIIRFDLARNFAGKGRYWTTCYYLDGVLIDSGCAHTSKELCAALSEYPLHTILHTHSHEDHIGADRRLLVQNPGVCIAAHPEALPVLTDPYKYQPLHPYRQLYWGWPQTVAAQALRDGEMITTERFKLQVIYTPGHSQDHLCIYEAEQGWLFSGDLFVGGQDRACRNDTDMWLLVSSLKRMAALELQILFPGCARMRQSPLDDLNAKIEYYERQGSRICDLHNAGRSENQIVQQVCGGPMWIEFVTLGHFSRKWLVRSYLDDRGISRG